MELTSIGSIPDIKITQALHKTEIILSSFSMMFVPSLMNLERRRENFMD